MSTIGAICSAQSGGLFAALFLDPLQALILSLRIADRLGQHLVQLGLGFLRFALGWLPWGHGPYVGIPDAELNPVGTVCMSASVRIRDSSWASLHVGLVPKGDIGNERAGQLRRPYLTIKKS
jgi:hypothetical protein